MHKTVDQQIQDLVDALNNTSNGPYATTTAGNPNALVGQGQQTAGNTVYIGNGSGQISQAQWGTLQQALAAFIGLNQAEQDEMKRLKEDHEIKSKGVKLAEFKKLHKDLRQFVINAFSWQESIEAINESGAEKDPRLVELETKDANSKMYTQGSTWSIGGAFDLSNYFAVMPLPKGLTKDELKAAHVEATLEEEMLNEQNDSNT